MIVARTPKGETLRIELHEIVQDTTIELGDDPGLEKDGVEAELQQLIAARVAALRDDLTLVRREFPTDIGPIDLLCRDGDGRAVVVEVKRVGDIAGVDQLLRYQERLDRDPQFAPTVGMFVAQQIKPQAKVYAESKGVACVEIDLERCAAASTPTSRSSEPCPRTDGTSVRAVLLLQCPDESGHRRRRRCVRRRRGRQHRRSRPALRPGRGSVPPARRVRRRRRHATELAHAFAPIAQRFAMQWERARPRRPAAGRDARLAAGPLSRRSPRAVPSRRDSG